MKTYMGVRALSVPFGRLLHYFSPAAAAEAHALMTGEIEPHEYGIRSIFAHDYHEWSMHRINHIIGGRGVRAAYAENVPHVEWDAQAYFPGVGFLYCDRGGENILTVAFVPHLCQYQLAQIGELIKKFQREGMKCQT